MGGRSQPRKLSAWLLVAVAVLSPRAAAAQDEAPRWTWVVGGALEGAAAEALAESGQKAYNYYQERSIYVGELKSEAALAEAPSGPTVFFGQVQAFEHPEWLEPLIEIEKGAVSVGGTTLSDDSVGLYVRSADGQRVAFSGLSAKGLLGIQSVPTGRHAATVTFDGRVAFEGSYRGTELGLTAGSAIYSLPSLDEVDVGLAALGDPSAAVVFSPVYGGGESRLSDRFRERLGGLVSGKSVLFFGEAHWNVEINRLFSDAFDWLMAERRVSTLFLEHSYSHSAHFQRYVSLRSDEEADRFWGSSLRALVMAQSTRDLLDSVRVWNREHPSSPVAVACLDAEFDYQRTLESALGEYFRGTVPDFTSQLPRPVTAAGALAEVSRLRKILRDSPVDAPRHPWMTADFVANGLTNLYESVVASDRHSRMADRQRSILRNVTEYHAACFTPAALERGLVVFKEGAAHASKHTERQDDAWWEATYLEKRFEPTRGRVATLTARALGYRLDLASEVDLRTHKRWAKSYHGLIETYRWGLRAGVIEEGGAYHFGPRKPSAIDMVAIRKAHERGEHAFLLESLLIPDLRAVNLEAGEELQGLFDAVVYVVGGSLEPTLRRADSARDAKPQAPR
jgi:hypothetical protein